MEHPLIPRDNSVSDLGRYGTWFICDRADLEAPIKVYNRPEDDAQFASDVAQFAAWHRGNIFPHLNGFRGFDCIRFEFCEGDPTDEEMTGPPA